MSTADKLAAVEARLARIEKALQQVAANQVAADEDMAETLAKIRGVLEGEDVQGLKNPEQRKREVAAFRARQARAAKRLGYPNVEKFVLEHGNIDYCPQGAKPYQKPKRKRRKKAG